MPLHKGLMKSGFKLPACEKHFHEHDETWLMLEGQAVGFWIDLDGKKELFELQAGDAWMIPAGFEHGLQGQAGEGFTISVFDGSLPPTCHKPGHYHMEKENYLPSLQIVRAPTDRYAARPQLPEKMKGVMFVAKGQAALQDEPTPTCGAGAILCQSIYTGLTNGTERNVLMGGNYGGSWPMRCGYQNVGRVLQVSPGVQGYAVGDVVFTANFCQHTQYFALDASKPDDPSHLTVKVPSDVDPKHAALMGMAGVAMHDVRRADVGLGDRVLVVGAGAIGQFTAQAARAAGADVTICDLDRRRLDIAAGMGLTTVQITGEDGWKALQAGGLFQAVFEDCGGPVLDQIIGSGWGKGLLVPRGKAVIIAGRKEVTYNFNAGQSCELTLLHAGHFVREDLLELLRLVRLGTIRVGPILQDVVPYTQAPALYDRLRDNPTSLLGTVFDWTC
jgi:2-desacetyl-2-hydroxyethyl bacteriochlorophyllide A dehydrogenase